MIFWVALRNLRVKWLQTLLTALAVALATAIALLVPIISSQVQRGAQDATQVFDLLITKKGSPTQAVLSSLFYQGAPIGNLPWSEFQSLERDERTTRAIPIGLGDNYAGFPVVGTNEKFFEQRLKPSEPPYFALREGRMFSAPFEAIVGAGVAQASGFKLGSSFTSDHGLSKLEPDEDGEHHTQKFTVVGILSSTGGPADRAVYTPMASVWAAHGIVAPEAREVTAILYTPKTIAGLYTVAQQVNASRRKGQGSARVPRDCASGGLLVIGDWFRQFCALALAEEPGKALEPQTPARPTTNDQIPAGGARA